MTNKKKKNKLLQTLIDYDIFIIIIIGFIIINFKNQLTNWFIRSLNSDQYNIFADALYKYLPIGLIILWLVLSFFHIRNVSYMKKTGRNYSVDHAKYKRSYGSLVEYFQDSEKHKLDTTDFPSKNWKETNGLIFGKYKTQLITIPSKSEGNIAVFGPPGSGKTSGLGIINAMQFKGSVLAVDIKGDIYNYITKHSKRKVIRFCPDHPDALNISCHFNPFNGIDKMTDTDRKLYFENMATVLVPDEGGSDGNYFSSRGRKMFRGITALILHENPDASFPDVVHQILQGNIFDWVEKALKSNCMDARELLSSFYGNSEKNVSSAYDALTTALLNFSNPLLDELLDNKKPSVCIDDLEKGYDVYLQISQEHLDTYAPLFTLLIESFSTAFTKRPDNAKNNRPILMLLDEFPQLTFSYELINKNLSTLRSKGIICMIIQQNLGQLEYRYRQDGSRAIVGNCNYQIILGSNDVVSSKYFSDLFGDKRVLKISNSETFSRNNTNGRSVQEATEKVFPPEYFGDLAANRKMILYFKGKYCECTKLNCYTS